VISPNRIHTVSRPDLAYVPIRPFSPPNPVYSAVEDLFLGLGMDATHAKTPAWNPLGEIIRPGDSVIVKPNLVSSKNLHQKITGDKLLASSTHGSLLRPVLDYVLRATGPSGKVRVVDTPVEGCEIEKVAGPLGIYAVVEYLQKQGHDIAFLDLRYFRVRPYFLLDDVRALGRSLNAGLLLRQSLLGDPLGYQVVDLKERSFFARADAPPGERLRFHRSHYLTPVVHHTDGKHEYSLPKTVLSADVVINLPKMKTHKKTGVTLSLKSVIGLTNEKYWLPHFTAGDPTVSGDEYDRAQEAAESLENRLSRFPLPGDHSLVLRAPKVSARPKVIDGSWEGNKTLWRTILDLNKILFFADRNGKLHDGPVRRYLTLVDGIVAGEGEGPLGATPIRAGLLIGGMNPVLADVVAARAMGFPIQSMPMLWEALGDALLPDSTLAALEHTQDGPPLSRPFVPPKSWPSLSVPEPS